MKPIALLGVASLALAGTAMAQQASGDPVRGKTVYARCAACHDLNTGATRLGPSLKGVVGRTSGTMPNFNYSQALKDKAVVWNAETLDAFLSGPSKYVPGNRMAFPPLANPQDRADLIAFLEQSAR
ncbi:c-type cytochrome [Novosphingobium jiangmenense]|uniref:Cytochrome c family protein n=1 Tax=Novosphingobium jiangmenense TaxID=2791981 RepID=A0ABS0HGT4_9SPHN|nr:cytochrome c family protein [Novosphingobium jiangmenense]MBF9151472.1 cytochrome c family protein [Novosphingobium jiangmenense]